MFRGIAFGFARTLFAFAVINSCFAQQGNWNDISGQGRGQSQFIMDSGKCKLTGQSAAAQQSTTDCSGKSCALIGVLNAISTSTAYNAAYNACMNAAGWVQGHASGASTVASEPLVTVNG